MEYIWLRIFIAITVLQFFPAAQAAESQRRVISLNGTWQIAEGTFDTVPTTFDHTIPVPGLADMATPAFAEVGASNKLRQAFWYRRTFRIDGAVPATAILKINKARYGTKVFLNGQLAGEHLPNFTPAFLDLKAYLRGGGAENELVIRIGANRADVDFDQPSGWDKEKLLYIPGIFDDVSLILTGTPYLVNVQTVPDIDKKSVGLVIEFDPASAGGPLQLEAQVVEVRTGRVAGEASVAVENLGASQVRSIELSVPIADCHLWSPEDPFLYELRLRTTGDTLITRFGMRSFRFDPETRRARLNGRPYYMRGTNVNTYRFFEDSERSNLPWDENWVRRLHQSFKDFHWNAMRYCIAFPPERWYDVADELGILIQDEFPIWLLAPKDTPEWPKAEKIIPEYTEWMRERWNHPSVVIWDAQNESVTKETGKAIQAVRHLDRSNRPWENGWSAPQSPTDPVEAHPYLMSPQFHLSQMPNRSPDPPLRRTQQGAPNAGIIINEYGWLWLGRNGEPTINTRAIYAAHVGADATVEQRRHFYARTLAALTEYWRAHRRAAAVMYIGALGYSRPEGNSIPESGVTADNFIDVKNVVYEPMFAEYVKDAFNPLGVMLNFWAKEAPAGGEQAMEVYLINDRYQAWQGDVIVRLFQDGKSVSSATAPARVDAIGQQILNVLVKLPTSPGSYTLSAEVRDPGGYTVRSLRDLNVVAP